MGHTCSAAFAWQIVSSPVNSDEEEAFRWMFCVRGNCSKVSRWKRVQEELDALFRRLKRWDIAKTRETSTSIRDLLVAEIMKKKGCPLSPADMKNYVLVLEHFFPTLLGLVISCGSYQEKVNIDSTDSLPRLLNHAWSVKRPFPCTINLPTL